MVDIKFLLALCSIASSPNLAPPHSTTQSAEVLFDFSRASAVEVSLVHVECILEKRNNQDLSSPFCLHHSLVGSNNSDTSITTSCI